MNTSTQSTVRRAVYYRRAAALLLVLGSVCLLTPRTSAQLGSLVVAITSPASGATVSGSIPVNASVTIVGMLTVAQVQFKLDSVNLGAPDTSSPYSISWDTKTASNGSHTLTAVARDGFGVDWTSQPVSVTVFNDVTPPAVSITSPATGANLRGAITVTATASDNVGVSGVQFRLDGANLGAEDTDAPYSSPWNTATAANGSHTLTAIARDAAGNTTTAASISVVVDNLAPAVSMTSPAAGSTVRGAIIVSANAADNIAVAGVQFFVDGAPLGAEDLIAPYEAGWNTTGASNASHVVTATARDAVGNVTTSAGVTVTVDNSVPAVTITSPAAGATVSGTISVSANASDDVAVAGVKFFVDGAMLGVEVTSAPFAVSWDTTAASGGSKVLTAVARDTAGNTATSAPVTVTVLNDATAPTVGITSPANGATVSAAITVTADAADNVAVAGVQFRLDGAMLGIEDTSAPYSVAWDTAAASNGSHTLTAVARDTAGNVTTSATVTVTVQNDATAPTVAITSPLNGATVSAAIIVSADAADNIAVAGVQFFLDGVALGGEDTTAPYSAAWDTTTSTDASHTLTATARDGAGNTSTSASITVTVSNQATSTVTRVEDSGAGISYTPAASWIEGYTGGFAWSGGTAALGFNAGQRATLTFTGTEVRWIGFRGPQTGIANVFLDGALVATVDAYNPTEVLQAPLYSTSGLANGPHTLAIEVTRTKNAAASDYYVVVDAFDVTAPGGGGPPDTTAPSVSISAPAGGATVSGTITVTANASDNVGVAGVKLFVDGAQVGAEDTAAPYALSWATATATNGAHTLTAVARDSAGNTTTSASVSVTVSNTSTPPAASATRIEDTDLSITYTPGTTAPGQPPNWFSGSRSRGWSDGTATFNRSAGARATVAFNGTSITWIGFRAFWAGIARVYVDGAFIAEVDMFLPPCTPEQRAQGCIDEDDQAPVFTASALAPGPHTLTVEPTGTKNSGSIDYAVVVDAFDVAPAHPPAAHGTRLEDTSASMSYTAGWTQGDTTSPWSGTTAAIAATAGARATVTFVGTEVSWVGRRAPQSGIARVYLDGSFQAEIDLYYETEIQGVVYLTTGLAPGTHTLAVEATGLKNSRATGTNVVVDAFDVRSRFEEHDARATYTGAWLQGFMDANWSGTSPNNGGGTAARSSTAGAQVEFAFSGTEVRLIAMRAPYAGIVDVFLDGALMERVDLYASAEAVQSTVFTATGLAGGSHTLRVEVTGLKNAAATGAFVFIDAFDVVLPQPAPAITRVQQNDAAVVYTPPPDAEGWGQSSPNYYYSGRTIALASNAGARATFTFTGTGVRWIGQRRRDAGMARVYIDSVLIGSIDLFVPVQDEFQAAVFSATGLSAGTHTLTIEVTGTKHGGSLCTFSPGPSPPPCSGGYIVVVDAFDIYPN